MSENGKIAALGHRGQMLALRSIGVRTIEVDDVSEAGDRLDELAGDGDLRLVFLSEAVAGHLGFEKIAGFRRDTGKIVMALPSHEGTTGLAAGWLRNAMERSIGVDLLSD